MNDLKEPPQKRRRIHKAWLFVQTFPDKPAAEAALKVENCWSYHYDNTSRLGRRVSYRCNAIKSRSKNQCKAAAYLLYHSENTDISLFRSSSAHTHDEEVADLVFKFSPEAEALIREMFQQNMKPKGMKIKLVEKGHEVPPNSKLETLLKTLRASKYGKEKLNLGSLEAWLIETSTVPQDEREAFVVNFEVDSCDNSAPQFRLELLCTENDFGVCVVLL